MTVRELIAELQLAPADAVICSSEGQKITECKVEELVELRCNRLYRGTNHVDPKTAAKYLANDSRVEAVRRYTIVTLS